MTEPQQHTHGELAPGTIIAGRYRVGRLLGRGGMGAVYEAEHLQLRRPVALKTLLPPREGGTGISARIVHEGRAAAAIGHPGIVDVFDLVEDNGLACVIMERLQGEELHERLRRDGPQTVDFVLRMGIEVASAIAAAHAHGIIHRDLKPRNVFIARDPRLGEVFKVLDFGIAKMMHDVDLRLSTQSGQVMGTPAYMSPERLSGDERVDGRSDLYSIGALMYETLAGVPPFAAATYPQLVLRISSERPRPLASFRSDLPAALIAAIEQALARDPDARQPSVAAFGAQLAAIAGGGPISMPATIEGVVVPSAGSIDTATAPQQPAPAPAARAGRKRLLAVGGLVALGAVAAAAIGSRAEDAREARAVEDAPPVAAPIAAVRSAPAPAAIVAAQAELPEPEQAAPALSKLQIETVPAGAAIAVDGGARCQTPCLLELPARELELQVTLAGYQPLRKRLSPPLPERLALELVARRRPSATRPSQSSADARLPPLLPR